MSIEIRFQATSPNFRVRFRFGGDKFKTDFDNAALNVGLKSAYFFGALFERDDFALRVDSDNVAVVACGVILSVGGCLVVDGLIRRLCVNLRGVNCVFCHRVIHLEKFWDSVIRIVKTAGDFDLRFVIKTVAVFVAVRRDKHALPAFTLVATGFASPAFKRPNGHAACFAELFGCEHVHHTFQKNVRAGPPP